MSNPNSKKPNILLIMVDQMTPFLTGAYGHPVVKTPNLDRLVEDGIRIDAAYSNCPLCAPARASFMTGQYVSQIGCYDNAALRSSAEPTIAHYLSIAGYDTVLSGKTHFIGPDQLHGFRRRTTTDIYPADFEWTTTREVMTKPQFGKPIAGQSVTAGIRMWSKGLAYDEETHFRALEHLHSRVEGVEAWQAGTKVKKPTSLVDLATTILDMAGVENRLSLDGKSLMGLINGTDTQKREVFSELHTAGVFATCFMIRKGQYKYNCVHGEDTQLFDLEADPDEWNNLSGKPEYQEKEEGLRARILERFDQDKIERDVTESLLKRQLIREAMKVNDTNWDYSPHFDATKQYVRGRAPVQY